MLISVINRSNGRINDQEMQRIIRAVNRQIAEDVQPHWSRTATLRLEGAVEGDPDPDEPRNMRGQAIIYVCECVDEEDYLGYHDLTYHGIPFGFVFIDIAERLGEPWSVTLSHEALELLLDPEVNLLVRGSHPEDPDKEVFHWYELCDAVQDETYEIDGVEVSNFVLPLYFTATEEESGRNDFLGTINPDGSWLGSFGVNPGGYVGFFDPDLGGHDTFTAHGDRRAAERMDIKMVAKRTRRALRYQRGAGDVGGEAPPSGKGSVPPPHFDCFVIETDRCGKRAADMVRKTLELALPGEWDVRAASDDHPEFGWLSTSQDAPPTVQEAWEASYQINEVPGVVSVEPIFEACLDPYKDPHDMSPPARSRGRKASGSGARDLPAALDDCEWSLRQTRVIEAWELFEGGEEGADLVIGHPDTGYTKHGEIWAKSPKVRRIDIDKDYDFMDNDRNAEDPREDGILKNPGHGTSTGSVIMSGKKGPGASRAYVSGAAPFAKLIPLRVTSSVVMLFNMRRLAQAIIYAADHGCHVISISLGGFRSRFVHRAIRYAESRGVIVMAAAGNKVRFVVWPAAYEEVIAVAATNVKEKPWSGSSRGRAVDVSAPGESVWRAAYDKKTGKQIAQPGNGTSYAVATTAGVAALWLSYHGVDDLRRSYPGAGLPAVFKDLLFNTTSTPGGWDSSRFGTGIVDAKALLEETLPSQAPGLGRRAARARRTTKDSRLDCVDQGTFALVFEPLGRQRVSDQLCEILDVPEDDLAASLSDVGDELLFHLMLDTDLRRSFHRAALGSRGRATRGRAPRTAARAFATGIRHRGLSRRLSEALRS